MRDIRRERRDGARGDNASILPIAALDNGHETFTVAARRGNVVWLPAYLIMPFVWSDDTSADWAEMRLDSFASKILLDAVEGLLK